MSLAMSGAGVYVGAGVGLKFRPVSAASPAELRHLVQTIAERIGRSLERAGLITRAVENSYLACERIVHTNGLMSATQSVGPG